MSGVVESKYSADRKLRFFGILENPTVSKIQRLILDGGRVAGLRAGLQKIEYQTVLEIGCGLGECSGVSRKGVRYVGIDNSLPRIQYAQGRYSQHTFIVGDALNLPFADRSFDVVMLIDTSHHLTDEQYCEVLDKIKSLSRKYIVVSDPLIYEGQNALSRFFYSLDRGTCFRNEQQSQTIFASVPGIRYQGAFAFRTFPGLYVHKGFILEVTG